MCASWTRSAAVPTTAIAPTGSFAASTCSAAINASPTPTAWPTKPASGGLAPTKTNYAKVGFRSPLPEGGKDASTGQPCLYTSECPDPLVCRDLVCTRECLTNVDCAQGANCVSSRCVTNSGTIVGTDGGVVTDPSGKVTLTIPKGSLKAPVAVVIAPLKVWPEGALGPVFQIEPTGLQFEGEPSSRTAIAIPISAPPCPSDLHLANAVRATWVPLASTLNLGQKTITATLAHLSVYGIVGNTAPKPDAGIDASIDASVDSSIDAGVDALSVARPVPVAERSPTGVARPLAMQLPTPIV